VRSPSGEQFEIAFEDQRATVVEVGGGLRTYSLGGRDVVDGYETDEICSSGRGQVLIPWPNRLAEGRYEFGGLSRQLPINEPTDKSAIHGLVRWRAWNAVEREEHRVVVEHDLHPQPGYPFSLALRIEYALSADGLRISTTATNVGSTRCPFGAGAHPYLLPGPPKIDTATLALPAHSTLEFERDGTPRGASSVRETEVDFRQARELGSMKLDHCFADLERDHDGIARVTLTRPEIGTGVTVWMDAAYRYVMLYTGDGRPDVDRRSLAVEPMTCPPQAFRTREGLVVLEPGDSMTATWGLSPSVPA
jgi:aldose 1-epimerase